MINALELCNCCEVNPADPRSAPGYCTRCEEAARDEVVCWHDTGSADGTS